MKSLKHSSCRHGCIRLPAVSHWHQCAWTLHRKCSRSSRHPSATSDSKGDSGMSPEEEAFYLEHLARKREERQRSIKEAARRSKLYASNRKANEQPQQADPATKKPAANPNPTDMPTLSKPSLPTNHTGTLPTQEVQQNHKDVAANSKPQLTAAAEQPTPSPSQHAPKSQSVTPKQSATSTTVSQPTAAAKITPSKPSVLPALNSRTSTKPRKRVGLPKNPLTSKGKTVRFPSKPNPAYSVANLDEDSDDDDDIDAEELAEMNAIAAKILANGKLPSDVKSVNITRQQPAKQGESQSPSQPTVSPQRNVSKLQSNTKQTVSLGTQPGKGSQNTAKGKAMNPSGASNNMHSIQAEAQLMQKLQAIIDEDSDSDDDDGGITKKDRLVNMDDIDWDALAAYENIEQSMSEQARVTTRLFSSTTGGPSDLDTAQPLKRPAASPQQPTSNSTLVAPARKPPSAPQPPRLFNNESSTEQNTAAGASNSSADTAASSQLKNTQTGSSDTSKNVDDVDKLLQLLDQVEQGTLPPTNKDDTGKDLSALEQLYLGKEWQGKELAGLPQASGTDYSESQPWCDEVSSLLLGLVLLSSKRHLKHELLPENTPEESRATAVWEAPWVLIVLDDSQKASLEYANQQALTMLGIQDFLDVYDLTMYDLLSPAVEDQQEWLWALNEIESQEKTHLMLPQLKLQTRSAADAQSQAKAVLAKNVQLFRIDSLGEEGYVGTAVLIKDWTYVVP